MFIIVIGFVSLFVLLICVVAIVMSTTRGSEWLHGLWQRYGGQGD